MTIPLEFRQQVLTYAVASIFPRPYPTLKDELGEPHYRVRREYINSLRSQLCNLVLTSRQLFQDCEQAFQVLDKQLEARIDRLAVRKHEMKNSVVDSASALAEWRHEQDEIRDEWTWSVEYRDIIRPSLARLDMMRRARSRVSYGEYRGF